MIKVSQVNPVKLATIKYDKLYDQDELIKCYNQKLQQDNLKSYVLPFVSNKYLLQQIINYAYKPEYPITLTTERTNFILPCSIEDTSSDEKTLDLYGVDDISTDIVWKINKTFVTTLHPKILGQINLSHSYMYNKVEYVCLELKKLNDLSRIKDIYTIVYKLMKTYNAMDDISCKFLLRDWFEHEISDYIYKVYRMTKETIHCNLSYINKDLDNKLIDFELYKIPSTYTKLVQTDE